MQDFEEIFGPVDPIMEQVGKSVKQDLASQVVAAMQHINEVEQAHAATDEALREVLRNLPAEELAALQMNCASQEAQDTLREEIRHRQDTA